ncbi:MAG TPA: hypothetical protein VHA52_10155, partial [Candidatus Babeliaceae bacterium]|nr:hypothetical protein [Candidatus Babeliaceae bacterium]
MEIKEGIKVYVDKNIVGDRILLSSGINRVDILNGVACKNPTYIAAKPWRKPTDEESEILMADKTDVSNFQTIGLIRIPENLANRFKRSGLENCKSYKEISSITAGDEYKQVLRDTIHYYEKFALVKNSSIPHNVYLGDANLINNTFNQKEKTFIGLHLDSFERDSATRESARNRICINLGKEHRYLLFYNLTFDQMAEMCGMERVARNG